MAFNERSLDDYVDVAHRIADFRELYPSGSLQPADPAHPWEQAVVTGFDKNGKQFASTMIVYTAAAYRTPDDQRPGIGVAWEVFPGRTPYTLGSELMNAETSAWGRAIVAVLASDSKGGVASRQEVKARRLEREDGLPSNADGSLSRSQTSDEQKDAAGVMTAAQHAEHTALQKGADGKLPPAEAAKVQHGIKATPPDDPFYDPVSDADPVDPALVRSMNIRLTSAGHRTKDQRLEKVRAVTGRKVGSTNDLTDAEVRKLLGVLDKEAKAAAP